MSTRSTRSRQRAVEAANASPARSTRSGGRSSSPASLNIGLRSSSPASPLSTSPTSTASRGRSRRPAGGSPASSGGRSTRKTVGQEPTPVKGRARRGRARGQRSNNAKLVNVDLQDAFSNDDDDESAELAGDQLPSLDTSPTLPSADQFSAADKNADVTSESVENFISDKISHDHEPDRTSPDAKPDDSDTPKTAAAAMAEIASQLELEADTAQWTEEHITQLESVLASDEGLQLLSEQPEAVEAINDMNITIPVGKVLKCSILESSS